MTVFSAVLNIIEWKRLLYFSFVIFLAKFCFLFGFGYETRLSFLDVGIFTTFCILLYCSNYLLTYYYHNSNLKTKKLYQIKTISLILVFIAVSLGLFFSFKINNLYFSIVFLIISFSVFFYSKHSNENSFTRYLVKSFTIPLTILFLLWLDEPIDLTMKQWGLFFELQFIIVAYLLLSFLSTLIEEIITGIKNINQDNLKKHKTLPILLGRKRAKKIALFILFTSTFLIFFLALYFIRIKYLFFTIIISNWLPKIYLISVLTKAATNSELELFLKKMNFFHFFGILGIVLIAYLYKHVI